MQTDVERAKEANRETAGKLATFVWIASGIYLFATSPKASFISWQSLVFFVVGMFVAAVVLGGVSYFIRTLLTDIGARIRLNPVIATVFAILGFVLLIADFVVGFLVARWAFHQLVG